MFLYLYVWHAGDWSYLGSVAGLMHTDHKRMHAANHLLEHELKPVLSVQVIQITTIERIDVTNIPHNLLGKRAGLAVIIWVAVVTRNHWLCERHYPCGSRAGALQAPDD